MPAIQSRIDVAGDAFQRSRTRMLALIERLRSLESRTRDASAEAKPLFDKRGQLLPRERIARLLDPGAMGRFRVMAFGRAWAAADDASTEPLGLFRFCLPRRAAD